MSKKLNPNALRVCKGEDCTSVDPISKRTIRKKHPVKDLLSWPTSQKELYCANCFNKRVQKTRDRNIMEDTIKRLFNISVVPAGMLHQAKMYMEKYNWSYSDITLALNFFKTQKQGDFRKKTLGILPYIMNEAKQFQEMQQQRQNEINALSFEEQPVKTVKVDMIASLEGRHKNKKSYREKQLISMEDFINEL